MMDVLNKIEVLEMRLGETEPYFTYSHAASDLQKVELPMSPAVLVKYDGSLNDLFEIVPHLSDGQFLF